MENDKITCPADVYDDISSVEHLRIENIRELRMCKLSNEDRIAYGNEMAALLAEVAELEVKKSDVAKRLKTDIEAAAQRANDIAKIIKAGEEIRDIGVSKTYDYDTLTVTYVRLDTGEEVERREMTPDERQMTILPDDDTDDSGEAPPLEDPVTVTPVQVIEVESADAGDITPMVTGE
jgi:hypothetical protein